MRVEIIKPRLGDLPEDAPIQRVFLGFEDERDAPAQGAARIGA